MLVCFVLNLDAVSLMSLLNVVFLIQRRGVARGFWVVTSMGRILKFCFMSSATRVVFLSWNPHGYNVKCYLGGFYMLVAGEIQFGVLLRWRLGGEKLFSHVNVSLPSCSLQLVAWCLSYSMNGESTCMFSVGQTVAKRLSCQVKRATASVKKLVAAYNSQSSDNGLPTSVTIEQALDASSDIYLCLQSSAAVRVNMYILMHKVHCAFWPLKCAFGTNLYCCIMC